jgi:hypothetical protein
MSEPSAFLLHCVVVVISLLFFPGALAFLATFRIFVVTPELADAPARLHAVAKHRHIAHLTLHNNKQKVIHFVGWVTLIDKWMSN